MNIARPVKSEVNEPPTGDAITQEGVGKQENVGEDNGGSDSGGEAKHPTHAVGRKERADARRQLREVSLFFLVFFSFWLICIL